MQFPAKDGSMHPSQMKAYDASKSAPSSQDDQPKSIQDDPKAMQCVDDLKSMGYTADDVAQAMGDDQQMQPTGKEATQAAPLQIPGM
jgi:hypothetical protein